MITRSNAKKVWVNQSPMDTDGMLVEQAKRNKAKNPTAKVFVYRNIVKVIFVCTDQGVIVIVNCINLFMLT